MSFFKKSVDSVLKQFTKAVTDLEAVAYRESESAELKEEAIRGLKASADENRREADRARESAAKIKALL